MILLFDENLSPKLAARLTDVFPGALHVDRVGLGGEPDEVVWEYAKQNNCTIVSKDSDFHEKSLIKGYPPKVVWIRRGNCSIRQIEIILRSHVEDIQTLIDDDSKAFLMLL